MKSEERHQLQESELEKWGRQAQEQFGKFSQDYGMVALVGVLAVCGVVGGIAWWMSSAKATKAERWDDVISASFDRDRGKATEQLAEAADRNFDYPAGQWAGLLEAEQALQIGIDTARTNHLTSADELTRARERFEKLVDVDSDLIQERSQFGLARTLEALAGVKVGDKEEAIGLDQALKEYNKFVEAYPDSIFVPFAKDRIKALERGDAAEFYTWLANEKVNPEDRKTPEDGGGNLPPGHSPVGPSGPDGPSIPFPGTGGPTATEDEIQERQNDLYEQIKDMHKAAGGTITGEKNPFEEFEDKPPKTDDSAKPDSGPSLTPPKDETAKTDDKPSPGPSLTPPKTDDAAKPAPEEKPEVDDKPAPKPSTDESKTPADDKPSE